MVGFGLFPFRSPLLRECSSRFARDRRNHADIYAELNAEKNQRKISVVISVYSAFLCEAQGSFSFPPLTEMFHFSGFAPYALNGPGNSVFSGIGFPHSEISGSKVARHLPGAYRSHATPFFASISQGIHHSPVNLI